MSELSNKMDIEEDIKISKQDQESLFEEELRKSNISITNDSSKCKYCDRMMSDMKKTAVRWLYMEWYKKAVLGLNLPSVSYSVSEAAIHKCSLEHVVIGLHLYQNGTPNVRVIYNIGKMNITTI